MEFRNADTFTDSLARLTGEEQKAIKSNAFDLQLNPAQPGMQLYKLDKARDPNFWSMRVSRTIRPFRFSKGQKTKAKRSGHGFRTTPTKA
jgi:hypothetical protein